MPISMTVNNTSSSANDADCNKLESLQPFLKTALLKIANEQTL
jgi:hypothetical protein